jgi:hypothetical protein
MMFIIQSDLQLEVWKPNDSSQVTVSPVTYMWDGAKVLTNSLVQFFRLSLMALVASRSLEYSKVCTMSILLMRA